MTKTFKSLVCRRADNALPTKCAWCQEWITPPSDVFYKGPVSHGACNVCKDNFLRNLEDDLTLANSQVLATV